MPPENYLPSFATRQIETSGARIHLATGGSGPPLLLLHGHPQTHLTWHKIAPRLAKRFTVVAPDLRGYGDSAKPDGGERHVNYGKRAIAADQVEVIRTLGFGRFAVVGHERGGRVAHRMALDHPHAVERIAVLDIAPTATMYARTNKEFAARYFWWFFLIQPAPLPERLIGADPEFFLRTHIEGQSKTPGSTSEALFQEYLRCYRDPATRHAICEDYRAAATIDLDHDAANAETGGLGRRFWRFGAPRARSDSSTTCWIPGARRRSTFADGRLRAGTRCRKRPRRKPCASCQPSWRRLRFNRLRARPGRPKV